MNYPTSRFACHNYYNFFTLTAVMLITDETGIDCAYQHRNIPLFASLTEADRENLANLLRRKSLERHEILFRKGDENAVRGILYSLSTRLRKTDNQLAEMCFLNLSARLAKKLVEMAMTQTSDEKQPQPCSLVISQQELGNILGVSRESINKELGILRDQAR